MADKGETDRGDEGDGVFRVVVWNCNRGLSSGNGARLLELEPDIAVVPECEKVPSWPHGSRPSSFFWSGDYDAKGLAVMSFGDTTLEPLGISLECPWLLPTKVHGSNPFVLLAMWTKQIQGWPSYAQQVSVAIDVIEQDFAGTPVMLAGDFNCSPQTRPATQHRSNVARLHALGLDNAFHLQGHTEHGAEGEPGTLFWKWREDQPFHCDFAFLPMTWRDDLNDVRVGTYSDWVGTRRSDHVPVVVDLLAPVVHEM